MIRASNQGFSPVQVSTMPPSGDAKLPRKGLESRFTTLYHCVSQFCTLVFYVMGGRLHIGTTVKQD